VTEGSSGNRAGSRAGLNALLEEIAGPTAAPGAGAVSGFVIAMSAGLIASAARRSPDWSAAKGVVAQAEALRARVERLAEENEAAYLAARSLIEGAEGDGGNASDKVLGKALDTAAELPLAIAEIAYDVVLLGAETAAHAAPGGADDAAAAAVLAEAASHAAAGLIAANLVSVPGDARVAYAHRLAAAASDAVRRSVSAQL
jgi:formiminotetrahydrofolate cyclodeaminase